MSCGSSVSLLRLDSRLRPFARALVAAGRRLDPRLQVTSTWRSRQTQECLLAAAASGDPSVHHPALHSRPERTRPRHRIGRLSPLSNSLRLFLADRCSLERTGWGVDKGGKAQKLHLLAQFPHHCQLTDSPITSHYVAFQATPGSDTARGAHRDP